LGLFTAFGPMLIFIALFVWMGASQEASMVQMRAALAGIPVARAMITYFHALTPTNPLSRAIEYVLAGFQQDFPVVEGEHVVGILTRTDLTAALGQRGQQTLVGDVMRREFVTVDPRDMLHTALAKLQECECHTLPVVQDGRLVGLMTTDNLAEVLMIQQSLRQSRPAPPGTTNAGWASPTPKALPAEQRPHLGA
jgi:predicted transcriptional regulator